MAEPTETDPPADKGSSVTNDSITESIFKHLSEDKNLTDDDRKSISEGLAGKAGGSLPAPVKPKPDHWSDRKLW